MPVRLDASDWPLVVAKFDCDRVEDELTSFLSTATAILRRKQRHAMVMDLTEVDQLDARKRQLIAEWTREHSPELREFRVAHCVIVKDAVQRGIVTAIDWLTPPPYPNAIVTSWPEAVEWVSARLAASSDVEPLEPPSR